MKKMGNELHIQNAAQGGVDESKTHDDDVRTDEEGGPKGPKMMMSDEIQKP